MGELGDVFELVLFGPGQVSSGRAEVRERHGEWHDARVWWAGRDKVREEGRRSSGALWLHVQDGERWWRWDETRGATTNTLGDPRERMVASALFMLVGHGRLAFDPEVAIEGRERLAGREAIVLRLAEREIAIDAEHGVTLRAVYKGKPIWEVADVTFGEPLPEGCFEFSAPPGVELEAASAARVPAKAPIEDVASRVDFTVFAPGPMTIRWPVDAQHWRARGESPEHVTVRLREAPIWIQQSKHWDPESFGSRFAAGSEWKHVARAGVELDVREHPAVVRLVQDGVHLEVYGGGAVEELIEVALSLRRVSASETN